jgi:GT2 family glycosyltransferase
MIRRAAFERVHGFSHEFTGPAFKGIDFSLRLREAGLPVLWTPAVTLFALDGGNGDGAEEYWRRPAGKIDAWRLSRKWSPAVTGSAASCEVVE